MAKLAAAQVPIALAGMSGEHERDSRTLRVEWACVPDVSHYCLAALAITADIVAGLEIHPERMRRNAEAVTDELGSEALMLALGERLGKQNSHEIVYDLSQAAYEEGRTLRELRSLRKMRNRLRQITVRTGIPADDAAETGQHLMEVNAVARANEGKTRCRELENHEPSARF